MANVKPEELDWNMIIRTAKKEQLEITITWDPEHVELSVRPWKPYEPMCPYGVRKEN